MPGARFVVDASESLAAVTLDVSQAAVLALPDDEPARAARRAAAALFTWARTADTTVAAYLTVLR